VESKLLKLIDDGNPQAIMFFLKTQGKHRGYTERTEQQQIGTFQTEVRLPKDFPLGDKAE